MILIKTRAPTIRNLRHNYNCLYLSYNDIHDDAAPPSKPTKPVIAMTTTSSIKISFSVESGTQPITHFLLNITVTKSGAELQKRFPIDEIKYIDSLKDVVNPEGDLIGYDVEMVVTGLKEREVYQFEVAAESSIGVGEFSEPSDNARLGELK